MSQCDFPQEGNGPGSKMCHTDAVLQMQKIMTQWPNSAHQNRCVDFSRFPPVLKSQDSFYSLQNMQNTEMKEFMP